MTVLWDDARERHDAEDADPRDWVFIGGTAYDRDELPGREEW